MKVCLLMPSSPWGGLAVHTLGLAKTLEERGNEVLVVELGPDRSGGQAPWNGKDRTEVRHINPGKELEELTWPESFRLVGKLEADVGVFAKGNVDQGSWGLDFAARIHFGRYFVIEQQMCQPMPPKVRRRHFMGLVPGLGLWWYQVLLRRYLRSIGPSRVICGSEAIRTGLIEHYGFSPRKTVTIHNKIDPDQFRPNSEYRRAIRAGWGIPQDAMVFGSVGRLSTEKGYSLALQLVRRLTSSLPHRDVRLVLVGEGPSEVRLKEAVREASLEDRVIFTGFIDRHWEAYPAFDVFILSSVFEGLPLALLEAMACGCVPIAMGVGGVPEVITDSSVGWLVEPGDRDGFFSAMRAAAQTDRSTLIEMGRHARERVVSKFHAKVQFSALAELIESEGGQSPHAASRGCAG